MQPTSHIWMNGELVPWDQAKVHVLTHALHYGDAVYEGIRCYLTDQGPAVFRLADHMKRLDYSARALRMPFTYSVEQMCEASLSLLRKTGLKHGYIRPLVFYGYGIMGLNPRDSKVDTIIACWPWGAYIPVDAADIKVSSYIRIHPRSTVADAKISGNYINSILAVLELRGTKYHEALFLDSDGMIAEGPGENFFIVKDGGLITPPLGTILPGITRATILEFARSLGRTVEERPIGLQEALAADEAFFTGTAAEVTPIRSIDDQLIGSGAAGPITLELKHAYLDLVHGRNAAYHHYLAWTDEAR
jgi:branched-chain amino acid aminotransferase